MVERTRRLRVGLAHSSPGASGVTARPNYVGPSGNGLVKRMNAGRKSCGIKGVRMGAPVRLQKAVPRSKEKRRSGAPRGERPTSLGVRRKALKCLPAPFGAPLPSPLVREHSPREPRGWEMLALPAPCENRGGEALAFLLTGLFEM